MAFILLDSHVFIASLLLALSVNWLVSGGGTSASCFAMVAVNVSKGELNTKDFRISTYSAKRYVVDCKISCNFH